MSTYPDDALYTLIEEARRFARITNWSDISRELENLYKFYRSDALCIIISTGPTGDTENLARQLRTALQPETKFQILDQKNMAPPQDQQPNDTCADVVCYIINASLGISLTDKDILQQYFLRREIPRLVVAVDKLDTLLPAEQQLVLDYFALSVKALSQKIRLVIPGEELATLIAQWRDAPDCLPLRQASVKAQLRISLEKMLGRLREWAAVLQEHQDEREETTKSEWKTIQEHRLALQDLQSQATERRDTTQQQTARLIENYHQGIQERLQLEVTRSKNPKEWYENDLPLKLRLEIAQFHRELESRILPRLNHDLATLRQSAAARYNAALTNPHLSELGSPGKRGAPQTEHLADWPNTRVWLRAGTTSATLGLAFLVAPWLAIPGAFLIASGEAFSNSMIREQSDYLAAKLPPVIEDIFRKIRFSITTEIDQVYARLMADVADAGAAWINTQEQSLRESAGFRNPQLLAAREMREALDKMHQSLT